MRKRLISFLMAMVMLFSVLPVNAFAAESIDDAPTTDEETCVHSYEPIVTAPTCTETGYTTYTCSLCGDSYTADETAALDHNYETVITAPTCTEAGFTTYTCSVCSDSYVADETAALDHNYEAVVIAPTCTEAGFTTYTCSACGDSYVADETSMIAHTEEIIPAVAPTCTETGLTEGKYCSACNEVLIAQEEVAKLNHNYVQGICSECGAITTYLEAPIANISNVASTGKLQLSWQAVDGAVSYDIYCAETEDGEFTYLNNITSTKVTHSSVTAGTSRYYYIVAVAEDGTKSAASNIIGGVCKLARPKLTASNVASTGKIKVSWDAVDGAVTYQLYKSTDGENFTLASTTKKTSITHSSSEVGIQYYYKVCAIAENSAANSADSAVKSRMCDLPQPKLTASNVASTGKVKVSWDAMEGAVKYQLYRSTDGENFTLASTTTKTSITHSSSEVGVQYYYKVRAIAKNSSANSAYSAVKSRTCDLARPSVSVERNSKDQPVVSWAPVSGATKYKIYIYDKDGELLKTNNTTKTSVTHSSATAGTKYTYQVRALCDISAATSAYSAAKSIMALSPVPEMKTTAKSTDSTITISWSESELASGYDVYRRASTNDSWTKVASVTSGSTTSYTDNNVNGRYYYSIAAYITVDNTKYAGSNSDAIRASTLAKPTISVEGSEDSLQNTISWGSVKGATAYQIYCQTGDALTDETSSWKRIATVEDSTSYIYNVERGVHYRYKVRAIYTYKSVTTYSPYSAVSDWYLHHEYPSFSVSMYEDSYDSVQGTLIGITNTGSSTIRFFTDGLWLDTDGGESDYDRSAKLYDYAAYAESETYIQIDYVDVAPGTTETLLVIADSLTRYHADTQIVLNMYYDGVYYVAVCNSHSPYYYITE